MHGNFLSGRGLRFDLAAAEIQDESGGKSGDPLVCFPGFAEGRPNLGRGLQKIQRKYSESPKACDENPCEKPALQLFGTRVDGVSTDEGKQRHDSKHGKDDGGLWLGKLVFRAVRAIRQATALHERIKDRQSQNSD